MRTYLAFKDKGTTSSGKTKIVDVISINREVKLGQIGWWGGWRQYAFFPEPKSMPLFNSECLREIADKCDTMTKEHKKK
jgi:hypothetical protein